jgi:hypothetical protein
MSTEVDLQAIASRRVVYRIPAMERVTVRRDTTYRAHDGSVQPIDLYYPPEVSAGSLTPAVAIITGYPDAGIHRIFGRFAKDLGSNASWAELIAASGLIAITYVNVDPVADAAGVLEHIREHAAAIGVDRDRIGLWSCSGNVPTAMSLLMSERHDCVRCAAFLFGYMLDLDGSTIVADMSRTIRFANPASGKSIENLRPDLSLFVARAGLDETPRLNETIDAFVSAALARNLAIEVVNHHRGRHAFDAVDDTDATSDVIRRVLSFLAGHLLRR